MHNLKEDELQAIALNKCKELFGEDDWLSMFSGNQDAFIDTYIAGYKHGNEKIDKSP